MDLAIAYTFEKHKNKPILSSDDAFQYLLKNVFSKKKWRKINGWLATIYKANSQWRPDTIYVIIVKRTTYLKGEVYNSIEVLVVA